MDWIIIFSIIFTQTPLKTTLFLHVRTRMWLISSHNLLRRSKLHYKQGQSTFWNNKISLIIFNPPCCYTKRQILLFIYFPLVLLQINSFWLPLLVQGIDASPTRRVVLSWFWIWLPVRLPQVRQCRQYHPYPTMHLGQVHLGVTTGLVPLGAISSH